MVRGHWNSPEAGVCRDSIPRGAQPDSQTQLDLWPLPKDAHRRVLALQWLYGAWLPRSGYVPDDHPCFEAWVGRPFSHGFEYFEINVHLPVRRG